jgi:hypothetical protein
MDLNPIKYCNAITYSLGQNLASAPDANKVKSSYFMPQTWN